MPACSSWRTSYGRVAREGEQFAGLPMDAYRLRRQQNEALKTCQSATALPRSNGVEAGRESG
jgi:hypothetical protein